MTVMRRSPDTNHYEFEDLFCFRVCVQLDCKTVGFFLKISKEIGKAWRKSLTRAEPHTPYGRVRLEKKKRIF